MGSELNENILQILAIVIGSGGTIGGIVTLLRLRSDTARTTVGAAEGAVIVQSNVITNLENENTRLREANEELRELLAVIDERKNARRVEDT